MELTMSTISNSGQVSLCTELSKQPGQGGFEADDEKGSASS